MSFPNILSLCLTFGISQKEHKFKILIITKVLRFARFWSLYHEFFGHNNFFCDKNVPFDQKHQFVRQFWMLTRYDPLIFSFRKNNAFSGVVSNRSVGSKWDRGFSSRKLVPLSRLITFYPTPPSEKFCKVTLLFSGNLAVKKKVIYTKISQKRTKKKKITLTVIKVFNR